MMYEASMSKSALLVWVRELTNIAAKQLEDLASGVHFCQLLHIYTKGKFALNRVKKQPKTETDCLHNLRLLQYGMEEHKIPYKLDITLIAKRNFRTILQTLQWWRKQFSKLPVDQLPTDRPKVKIQIMKPLQLIEPPVQPVKPQNPSENKDSLNNKTPKVPSDEQILHILHRNSKYSAPKEKLLVEDEPNHESNKENQHNPYPSLEYDPIPKPLVPSSIQKEEKKQEMKQDQIKYSNKQKMNNYSFGRQECLEIQKNDQILPELHPIKPVFSEQKIIPQQNTPAPSTTAQASQLTPQPESLQQQRKESRIPITYRSVEKVDPQQKQSKTKDEHPSTKPKSIPKVASITPQQSRDRREISPNVSERTNLLSMMEVSEKKGGRMM